MLNFIITFFFLYAIPIVGIPINTGKIIFILLTFYWIYHCANEREVIVNRFVFFFCLFFIALIFFTFLKTIISEQYDFSLSYTFFVNLTENCFGSYLLCHFFVKNNVEINKLLQILIVVSFVQATIILSSVVVPDIRELFFLINKNGEKYRAIFERYGGVRGLGFSGAVTFDLASFLSLSCFFYFYLHKNYIYLSSIKYALMIVVVFIAMLITGRTGMFGVFLSILFCVFVFKGIKFLKLFGTFLCLVVWVFFLIHINIDDYAVLNVMYSYAFELFLNVYDGGRVETSSTKILWEMLSIPISEITYLIGDGRWLSISGDNSYYRETDAGYIRHVLFYGAVATLMVFVMFFLYCIYIINYIKKIGLRDYSIMLLLILVLYLIVQIKGDFIFGSGMNMKVLFILSFFPLMTYKKNEKDINFLS